MEPNLFIDESDIFTSKKKPAPSFDINFFENEKKDDRFIDSDFNL